MIDSSACHLVVTKLKHQLVEQNVNLLSKFGYKRKAWVEISVISRCVAQSAPWLPISWCHLGFTFLNITELMVGPPSRTSPINLWLLQHWFWFHSINFISRSNLYILNRGTYRYSFYQTRTYEYIIYSTSLLPRGNILSLEESEEMSGSVSLVFRII